MLKAINRPGIWDFNAWSGALIGLRLNEAMASLPDGVDRDFACDLFVIAEIAFVRAAGEAADKRKG